MAQEVPNGPPCGEEVVQPLLPTVCARRQVDEGHISAPQLQEPFEADQGLVNLRFQHHIRVERNVHLPPFEWYKFPIGQRSGALLVLG
jgi:hypothetical protein